MNMMGEAHEHHITIDDGTSLSYFERRRIYQKLHLAALDGDWKTAKKCFTKYGHEISWNTKITKRNETVLHIAVISGKVDFVKHVVRMMSDDDLDVQDDAGNTAFFLAVIAGKVNCVDFMMKRKPNLAITRGGNHELPLYVAASRGYSKIIRLLYVATKSILEYDDKLNIFIALIYSNIYDVALDMLKEDNTLALGRNTNDVTALHVLARKPSLTADISSKNEPTEITTWKNFISQDPLLVRYMNFMRVENKNFKRRKAFELMKCIWDRVMELDDSEIIIDFSPLIFTAAEKGNAEFLTIPFHSYPNLMLKDDDKGYTIFHIAILHRHEDIFRLIHDFYSVTEKITLYRDRDGNNMLHLAAKLPSDTSRLHVVPGAALQLQRELLWFEEVKKVVPLMPCLEAENKRGQTPEVLFMESHKKMLEEGEKWMKGTASKCILVATLIATMVFAAVLNLPTQSDSPAQNGHFETQAQYESPAPSGSNTIEAVVVDIAFVSFIIADALSLVLSVASAMVFLGIITSRYQLYDFYLSLPRKLIVGLTTLFISLVTMLVAFALAIFMAFYNSYGLEWVDISLILIGSTPIILFVWMELRLFTNVYVQTFRSDFIFKRNKLLYKFYN